MIPTALALACLAAPVFDEGYDLLVLDAPRRIVVGDPLVLGVQGRPGNRYVAFIDATLLPQSRRIGNLWIHLSLGPAAFAAGFGLLPASGRVVHTVKVPNIPALGGLTIHAQAFGLDAGVVLGATSTDSKPVTLERERGQPLITLLTLNRIPRDRNGSEVREGILMVPPTGAILDVLFHDRGKGAIDPKSLVVTADKALGGGSVQPGTNLAKFLTVNGSLATGVVTKAWEFPAEVNVTLKAKVKNVRGVQAPEESFTFFVRKFTTQQPFKTKQLWFLDFTTHDADRNGLGDFREDLGFYGLSTNAKSASGPSFNVFEWAKREIQRVLRRNFGVGTQDAVNVDFLLKRPAATHATICVGGRNPFPKNQLPPGAQETTGAAFFNRHNRVKNFRICGGVLGVHPRSIFFLFRNVPAFRQVFGVLQKTPVGKDADDPVVTKPGFDPNKGTARQKQRFLRIQAGVRALANATAFVLTQETGHSMGLVPTGRLPFGLLGGFTNGHSTPFHFDDGLGNFMSGNNSTPAPAQPANLGLVWDHFQSGRGHFTRLNWAYLRERIVN